MNKTILGTLLRVTFANLIWLIGLWIYNSCKYLMPYSWVLETILDSIRIIFFPIVVFFMFNSLFFLAFNIDKIERKQNEKKI